MDEWAIKAEITTENIFRRVGKKGAVGEMGITPKAIWHVVKAAAQRAEILNLAP